MKVSVVQADCTEYETPLLVANIFEDGGELTGPIAKLDGKMGGLISAVIRSGDFKGKECQTSLLYPPSGSVGAERVLLVGLGKLDGLDLERLRKAAGTAVKQASKLGVRRLASLVSGRHSGESRRGPVHGIAMQRYPEAPVSELISPRDAARALTEGAVLGAYLFDEFKTRDDDEERERVDELVLLEKEPEKAAEIEEGSGIGGIVAGAENFARTLGNLPGNIATPTYLAERADEIAKEFGMTVGTLGPAEMVEEGLTALLAVAAGSEQEPRLIVLEHRRGGKDDKPIVLLGKGLTFDAGGISIKPAQSMEEMKFDMCGGAAVLGAMRAIGELGLELNVIGVVPSSENLLSGAAMKPGDIIRSHLGKTIEVVNTDAEGRLILADALSYLRRFDPAAVVDAATLTGACVIALGHQASGALGNDEGLLAEVRAAAERTGERIWPLPMYDEFREQIKSDYADIKNTGGRPAGTATAAWFLREFVGDFPWLHLDIAGTAYGDGKLPYQTKGATGVPTRLFVEWVLSRTH